jgi:hypothetical protein
LIWFSTLSFTVDRARRILGPASNTDSSTSAAKSWSASESSSPPKRADAVASTRPGARRSGHRTSRRTRAGTPNRAFSYFDGANSPSFPCGQRPAASFSAIRRAILVIFRG